MAKIRPGRIAACNVQLGDIVMEAPSDGGRAIGTVVNVHTTGAEGIRFSVRVDGRVISWPTYPRKPFAPERAVWVHVPSSNA